MDGAPIELPGEAYPLNASTLYHTLVSASSRDRQQIQTGTRQLEAWENEKGFYSLLQDAFLERQLPDELRLLSLIQLKNGIDKHWRKGSSSSLAEDEKTKIRDRLLTGTLSEANPRFIRLSAIIVSRVARSDYPNPWPTLLTDIADALRQSTRDTPRLNIALEITLQVVKELSSVRLGPARGAFQSTAVELLYVLDSLSAEKIQPWLHAMHAKAGSTADVVPLMETSAKILKVHRRLAIAGCQTPHQETIIQRQWQASSKLFSSLLELFMQPSLDSACKALLARHMLHFIKFHLNMARTHPVSFGLLPGTRELVWTHWTHAKQMREKQLKAPEIAASEHATYFFEKFNLSTLLLLRACFKIAFSPHQIFNLRQKPNRDDMEQVKTAVKEQWLTEPMCLDIFENLLNKFFVCIQTDIEEWFADAEEWEMKEEGTEDAMELSVRPCAERLFLDLVINRQQLVQSQLQNVAQVITQASDPLIKDAAYSALGTAAPAISSIIDFDAILEKHVVDDLRTEGTNSNVLRRRIAILISQWVRVRVGDDKLPLVYQIYQHLLDPDVPNNDEAVRITAGKKLLDVVVVWNFKSEIFGPYAPTILKHLAGLISEVNLVETKLALLSTLSAVIERMELQVGQLADQIVGLLPPLWAESGTEYMLKQAVVTVLVRLVDSLKGNSAPLHPLVIPVIREALDPQSEARLYLLDDALDLLAQVVKQSEAASPELLSLVPLLLPIMEWDNDLLDSVLNIVESLVLLAPEQMLSDPGIRRALVAHLGGLIQARKRHIRDPAGDLVELLIRSTESRGLELLGELVSDLVQTEVLPKAISAVIAKWGDNADHTTVNGARQGGDSATGSRTSNDANFLDDRGLGSNGVGSTPGRAVPDSEHFLNFFIILSRIIFYSPEIFIQVVASYSQAQAIAVDRVLLMIFEEWIRYMDQVTMPTRSKLMCLAFAKLLSTNQQWMLGLLEGLMSTWSSVVLELRDEEDEAGTDSLVYKQPDVMSPIIGESPEDFRRRRLTYSDPVHTIHLPRYLKAAFDAAVQANGGEAAFQERWLSNMVDSGTWSLFRAKAIAC